MKKRGIGIVLGLALILSSCGTQNTESAEPASAIDTTSAKSAEAAQEETPAKEGAGDVEKTIAKEDDAAGQEAQKEAADAAESTVEAPEEEPNGPGSETAELIASVQRTGNTAAETETSSVGEPETNPAAAEPFFIGDVELQQEIEYIRAHYYTPGEGDTKVVLNNGDYGWNYSREYYFYQGRLLFAFLYNGTEEHRLYFKDDHMIRYIDEYGTIYDFGNLDGFSDWAGRVLEEAYRVSGYTPGAVLQDGEEKASVVEENTAPASGETAAPEAGTQGWLGTWYASDGESLEISGISDTGITLVYNGWTASGESLFHSSYELYFENDEKTCAGEDYAVVNASGWRYILYLEEDQIRMTSRYPDRYFNRG